MKFKQFITYEKSDVINLPDSTNNIPEINLTANDSILIKEKQQAYYEANREKESERKAQFYADNKEALLEKYNQNKDVVNARRRERYALKKAQQSS